MDQRKIFWSDSYLFTSSNSHLGYLSSLDMNHSSDTNHVSLSSVTDVVDVHFVRRRIRTMCSRDPLVRDKTSSCRMRIGRPPLMGYFRFEYILVKIMYSMSIYARSVDGEWRGR